MSFRSDSGSCSSRTSNLSSLTKSSGICPSQSPGSVAALSDVVSYLSTSCLSSVEVYMLQLTLLCAVTGCADADER